MHSGTGESRESDVNTTDWWRTVKMPFVKEKQEASCGRPSQSKWEETAGRKPHLQSSERLSCGLQPNSCLSVSIGLAFWPKHSRSSFQYHYNNLFFLTSQIFPPPYYCCPFLLPLCPGVRAVYSRRGFCDLLLDTTSWAFFFFPPAMKIAWSQRSKSTAQPSGLWISLNTGHSSLSCMWIFSLVQFQIN